MLTDYKVIRDRIKSAWFPHEKAYLYQQLVYQLGQEISYKERGKLDGDDLWGDDLRYFPAVEILDIIKGHSRRPLNANYIMQSRVMGEMPEPMFPQLDPYTAEARKQWCLNRDKQRYSLGEWFTHLTDCFNYADSLGYGCVQVGPKIDPYDQTRTVGVQSVSPLNMLWDPLAPHPSQSSWMAVVHYMTPDDAIALYGGKKRKVIQQQSQPAWKTVASQEWDIVRVIEYYDMGTGKGEPTYAVIIGHIGKDDAFAMREFNPRSDLPFAIMVNFVAPGMRRPVGRVHLQLQSAKMLNLLETYMHRTLSMQPDVDLIFEEAIHPDDWLKLQEGKPITHLRLRKQVDKQPWYRIDKKDIPRSVLQMMDYYNRQYTEDSGLSELDRGVTPEKVRSASEINLIQSNSQINQGWIPREAMRFTSRFYQRAVMVGKDEDEKQILIDYKGNNIPYNDPDALEQYPNLRVEKILEEFSTIIIDQQALSAADDEIKKQRRQVFLQSLLALGLPVDPAWITEEYLAAGGKDDAKIAMGQAGTSAPMSGTNPAALQVMTTGQAPTTPMGT